VVAPEWLARWPFNDPIRSAWKTGEIRKRRKTNCVKDWAHRRSRQEGRGWIFFGAGKDDLITSSGYRIGPAEIEDCLIKHKSVSMAAVIGSPDPVRGEIVKAFIVLKPDVSPSTALHEEIQNFVKTRLAAHEYPREIDFVKEFHDHHRQDHAGNGEDGYKKEVCKTICRVSPSSRTVGLI
jgi:acyl-coenzyme A synthetase/AMP-(fatty) acid ligase